MPKSGASRSVRQNRPTTTGASTIGRMATTRNQPWPRFICITSSASARPSTTCSTTVDAGVDETDQQRRPERGRRSSARVVVQSDEAVSERHREVHPERAGPDQEDQRQRRRCQQHQERRRQQCDREPALALRQHAAEIARRSRSQYLPSLWPASPVQPRIIGSTRRCASSSASFVVA